MKRIGNLFEKIISIDNLKLADAKARKGKYRQKDVRLHISQEKYNLENLHKILKVGQFKNSEYSTFVILEPKSRLIHKLPYFPDRIVHHALMNILEPIFIKTFTADTYSCIKRRGIHKAFYKLKKALKNENETKYFLKLDIKKFFPNVDHSILKSLLKNKFKDGKLLSLLDEIIDSCEGLPIGNYLSQFFANFYLSYFDHWIKEDNRVQHYFRYCDDLVILSSNKENLWLLKSKIEKYLRDNLKLLIKENYRVSPLAQGLDFLGYKFYHTHIKLRKSIKNNFKRMLNFNPNGKSIVSYYGWIKHCNGKNLLNKHVTKFYE